MQNGLCGWAAWVGRVFACVVLVGGAGCAARFDGGAEARRGDLVVGDFEGVGYGAWTATGSAFVKGPAAGEQRRVLEIENAVGEGTASSEMDGDGPRGTLVSPEFTVERDFVAFRVGGGDYEYATCVNLLVDGRIVRSATGWRSDHLTPVSWDVREWKGKRARVELVDQSSGDWGHVNVDQVVQTDSPERRPVEIGALYHEALRPQYHFTARQWAMTRLNPGQQQEGWINDLNGLVFYDGEYHLFAQRWAKCWLHAVSRDLVHWTELAPAFWEEEQGSGVQSGSIVVDHGNTSGLGKPGEPAMVAFWSRFDNRSQCICYSLDHGRTWTRYAKNPIFVRAERDPKVFWYGPKQGGHWVMAMYGDGQYHVLTSPNLLEWTDQKNPLPECFECPDLFELPVDGDATKTKWVLVQGSGKYSVGSFDGRKFTEETPRLACDIGPHFYATQSWENLGTTAGGLAPSGGRRVQAAWMNCGGGGYPDMPFNQQVSFPCELTLRTTASGVRLFREPVREIESLQGKADVWSGRTLRGGQVLPLVAAGDCYRIVAELSVSGGAKAVLDVRGTRVVVTRSGLESGDAKGSVSDEVRRVELLVDRASVEVFVNGGELSSTRCFVPTASGISLRAEGGKVVVKSMTVWPLRSAWE
ncbi:MAG: glycoside hydrolase family 32 protein [Phycisphaerales bacterium]